MRRIVRFKFMVVGVPFLFSGTAAACPNSSAPQRPAEIARSFYRYHFSHDQMFSLEALAARRKWLAPGLYSLLRYELMRDQPEDEPPFIEGDPFTDSQEEPTSYVVGAVREIGSSATVAITFIWKERARILERRPCTVKLVKSGGTWQIADIIGKASGSLEKELTDLKHKDELAAQKNAISGKRHDRKPRSR